jgi:hypothetical protein
LLEWYDALYRSFVREKLVFLDVEILKKCDIIKLTWQLNTVSGG